MNFRNQSMEIPVPDKTIPHYRRFKGLYEVPTKCPPAFRVPKEYQEAVSCLKDRVTYLHIKRNSYPPSDTAVRFWERPFVELLKRIGDVDKVVNATHWLAKNWDKNEYIPYVTTGTSLNDKFCKVLRAIEREGGSLKPLPKELRAKKVKMSGSECQNDRNHTPFTGNLFFVQAPFNLFELESLNSNSFYWELMDAITPHEAIADYGWWLVRFARRDQSMNISQDSCRPGGVLFERWKAGMNVTGN